jgi:hypothetical protein
MFGKSCESGVKTPSSRSPVFKCVYFPVFLKPFNSETEGLVSYFPNSGMDLSVNPESMEYIFNTLYIRKPFKDYTIHSYVLYGNIMIFKKDNID